MIVLQLSSDIFSINAQTFSSILHKIVFFSDFLLKILILLKREIWYKLQLNLSLEFVYDKVISLFIVLFYYLFLN